MIRGRTVALGLILVMLVSAPVVGATAGVSGEQTVSDTRSADPPPLANATLPGEPTNDTLRNGAVTAGATTAGRASDRRALTVVLTNRTNTTDRRETLSTYGVSIDRRHGRFLDTTIPIANVSRVRALAWVERAHVPIRSQPALVSAAPETLNATRLQSTGTTGAGVDVGVIDGGFDSSNREIADQITATRSFVGNDITGGGRAAHGTAVSEVVTDVAPDASLHLAAVGRGTRARFADAVDWLVETQDVDVIVYSRGLIVAPEDGSSPDSRTAAAAVRSGTTFVAAAGNEAQVHWRGRPTDADGDGAIEFAPGDEANEFRLSSERDVTVVLDWQDWPVTDEDYDLYLYRAVEEGEDQLVGRSTRRQDGDDAPFELIDRRLQAGIYYAVIDGRAATGSAPIELTCYGCGEIGNRNPAYSISAPAAAGPVTAVGGYDVDRQALASYSSRGPTADGRRGIDLIGPTGLNSSVYGNFAGTSASAPAIGGAVALLEEIGDDISPDDATSALRRAARDRGNPGPDPATGFGLADVAAATTRIERVNQPPIADAGPNESVVADTSFTLDASGSRDPDGDSLDYQWEQIDGPSVPTPPATAQPTLTAPSVSVDRELVFELTVDDGQGQTDTDRVTVTVVAPETRAAPGSGGGPVYPGATVFQGEADITFGGALTPTLVGVGVADDAVTVSPPVQRDAPVGRYTNDGSSDAPGVTVVRPAVETISISTTNGTDVAGDRIQAGVTDRLVVNATSNFEVAEPLAIDVTASDGRAVTDTVLVSPTTSPTQAEGPATAAGNPADPSTLDDDPDRAVWLVDVGALNPGTYTVTVAGSDDLDTTATARTATVSVTTTGDGPGDLTDNGDPATDVDGDGVYEDINGDGRVTATDVTALFRVLLRDDPVVGSPQLDINSANDGATTADVTRLFDSVVQGVYSSVRPS